MAYVMVFVKESHRDKMGKVALDLIAVGLDGVLVFDDLGVICGKADGWIADRFLTNEIKIDAIDKADVCGNKLTRGNTQDLDAYWDIVRTCLARFLKKSESEAEALVNGYKDKLYHNPMLYHDEAFNVACQLAGLDRDQEEKVQEEHWEEYVALLHG
jgi:hypothetical protein